MTNHGFNAGLNRLRAFYGEKFFPSARTKIVAERLNLLTDEDFQNVCDEIIAHRNTAPDLEAFLKYSKPLRDKRYEEWRLAMERELNSRPICSHCKNTGYVNKWTQRNGHWYEFAFGCPDLNCLAAKLKIPPSYTRWSDEYKDHYFDSYERNNP